MVIKAVTDTRGSFLDFVGFEDLKKGVVARDVTSMARMMTLLEIASDMIEGLRRKNQTSKELLRLCAGLLEDQLVFVTCPEVKKSIEVSLLHLACYNE